MLCSRKYLSAHQLHKVQDTLVLGWNGDTGMGMTHTDPGMEWGHGHANETVDGGGNTQHTHMQKRGLQNRSGEPADTHLRNQPNRFDM